MNLKIENMPAYKIAFMRHVGPYGLNNVRVMESLKKWAAQQQLLNDKSTLLGIALDNPQHVKAKDCRYDTCIVIENEDSRELKPFENHNVDGYNIQEGMIAGGNYAVFEIVHTAEAMQEAWASIFKDLELKHFSLDASRPIIERYKAELVNNHYCEICVPISIE